MIKKGTELETKKKISFTIKNCQNIKIKLITIHPIKEWIAFINANNTFSLWNYSQNILIKSFGSSNLDESKNIDIRDLLFFDRYSMPSLDSKKNMKNNILFVAPTKIFFFDYSRQIVKHTNEFQQNIRKVCVYSQTKICIAMSDGSFKVLDSKDLYSKNSMHVKTIRGYHTKSINWIFSYSQNYNEMPRIITASPQDSLMACWNVDMILNSAQQVQQASPCFKFLMGSKNKGKDSNNGEQIISLQYDPTSYHLITLTQSYIAIWSTMTGMQLKRLKNQIKFRQILFFNHFSYGSDCFLAHGNSGKVYIVRASTNEIQVDDSIDLRPLQQLSQNQNQIMIQSLKCLSHQPSNLFVVTQNNLAILELDKFYRPAFGVHCGFLTRLSTINSRELIIKGEGQIRQDITSKELKKMKFEDEILINTFYISADPNWIYFNLIEIQYSSVIFLVIQMLHELKRYKFSKISQLSPFKEIQGSRCNVFVNPEGKEIIIFNKSIYYYEIYQSQETIDSHESLLDRTDSTSNLIDFYKKMKLIGGGYCRDIVWHQYKNQYAAIVGYDENNQIVEYKIARQKKGMFKKDVEKMQLSATIKKHCCVIYQKSGSSQYKIVEKSQYFQNDRYQVYNMGNFFAYSCLNKQKKNILNFICSDRNALKEIEGELFAPENMYMSYCQNFYIASYDGYFIIYKMQENGLMVYLRTVEHSILHGIFWEKLFFYVTSFELYFLQILNSEIILIKLADSTNVNPVDTVVQSPQDDDLEPFCALLPPGQVQISFIINMNLVLLSESGNITLIPFDEFPYVKFCAEVSCGIISEGYSLYEKASPSIQRYMKETLTNYGMVLPDLMN